MTLLLNHPCDLTEDSGLFKVIGIVWGKYKDEYLTEWEWEGCRLAVLGTFPRLPWEQSPVVGVLFWSCLDACFVGTENGQFLLRKSPVGVGRAWLKCPDSVWSVQMVESRGRFYRCHKVVWTTQKTKRECGEGCHHFPQGLAIAHWYLHPRRHLKVGFLST